MEKIKKWRDKHPLLDYVIKRILFMIVALFVTLTITFFLMNLLPGSPIKNLDKLADSQRELIEASLGLNDPVYIRYFDYLRQVFIEWDLGISTAYSRMPVQEVIIERAPLTIQIGLMSFLLSLVIGVALGVIASTRKNTWIDYTATIIAVLGIAIPSFVLGPLLQQFLSVEAGLFPVTYIEGDSSSLVLPVITLSFVAVARFQRFTRTEMLDSLNSDYVQLARAKGVSKFNVTIKHAFRNTLVTLITLMVPTLLALITGSLIIETVFNIPGMGAVLVKSIKESDYYMTMASVMFFSVIYFVAYLALDLLYAVVDPRIRVEGGSK